MVESYEKCVFDIKCYKTICATYIFSRNLEYFFCNTIYLRLVFSTHLHICYWCWQWDCGYTIHHLIAVDSWKDIPQATLAKNDCYLDIYSFSNYMLYLYAQISSRGDKYIADHRWNNADTGSGFFSSTLQYIVCWMLSNYTLIVAPNERNLWMDQT